MKIELYNGIDMVASPGEVTSQNGATTPSRTSIEILRKIATNFNSIVDKYPNKNIAICIDYFPITVYTGDDVRTSDTYYCSFIHSQDRKVVFRKRPTTNLPKDKEEKVLSGLLSKHLFNYSALDRMHASSARVKTKADLERYIIALDNLCACILETLSYFKVKSGYKPNYSNVADAVQVLISTIDEVDSSGSIDIAIAMLASAIARISSEIEKLSDTTYTLSLFVLEQETSALKAINFIKEFEHDEIIELASGCQYLPTLQALTFTTASLKCFELLKTTTSGSLNRNLSNTAIKENIADNLSAYMINGEFNDEDLASLYDKHLLIANYELMCLYRRIPRKQKSCLLDTLDEYVPLISRFDNVPNPIMDNRAVLSKLLEDSTGIWSVAAFRYATSVANRFEVMSTLLDTQEDNDYMLTDIMIPCSLFDALMSNYFVKPDRNLFKDNKAGIRDEFFIKYSPYLSAILMCVLVRDKRCLLTDNDATRFNSDNFIAGYFTYDSSEDSDGNRIMSPRSLAYTNNFNVFGYTVPVNCGRSIRQLSLYNLLLSKALLASHINPLRIDDIKLNMGFVGNWLNLKADRISSLFEFGG